MDIVEYDEIDPTSALELSMLALDFPFSADYAAEMRHKDPRPFPCLALYAVEKDVVLGQLGILRLPLVSTRGREYVGSIWAAATHPHHMGRGVASSLLDEAHRRMVAAGLQYSMIATKRQSVAHRLYQCHGYVDMQVMATALARWETAHQPTRLRAEPRGPDGFAFVEALLSSIARDRLGFAWKDAPSALQRSQVHPGDVRALWNGRQPVGCVLIQLRGPLLSISNLLLADGIAAPEAVAAVVAHLRTPFIRVSISRPGEAEGLSRSGYRVIHPDCDAFMLKPLTPDVSAEEGRRIFGIGTDRFLIPWLDST